MNENLYSLRIEQNVIGTLITAGKGHDLVFERLTPDSFVSTKHAVLFKYIQTQYQNGEGFDVEVIINQIRMNPADSRIVSQKDIEKIYIDSVVSYNLENQVDQLVEHERRRALFAAGERIKVVASDTIQYTSDSAREQSESILSALDNHKVGNELFQAHDLAIELFAKINKRMEDRANGVEQIDGVVTGFRDIDNRVGRLGRGEMIVIAARPSMGKTALALDMMLNISFIQQKPVLFQSAEMPRDAIVSRLVSNIGSVNNTDIRNATIPDLKWEGFQKATMQLKKSMLHIDDTSAPTISHIRRNCRKIKAKYGYVGAVFIDYLTLLTSPLKTDQNHLAVGAISKALSALAKEFDCPVFVLSQLSRDVEKRKDSRPVLSDLRESGQVEQDANVVLFIYRDVIYNKDTKHPHIAEIIAAKVREGEVGTCYLETQFQYSRFANLELGFSDDADDVPSVRR